MSILKDAITKFANSENAARFIEFARKFNPESTIQLLTIVTTIESLIVKALANEESQEEQIYYLDDGKTVVSIFIHVMFDEGEQEKIVEIYPKVYLKLSEELLAEIADIGLSSEDTMHDPNDNLIYLFSDEF